MSDPNSNPYQVSQVQETPAQIDSTWSGTVTAKTRVDFGKGAPWWQFLAVMTFIGCGIMIVAGIALFFWGNAMTRSSTSFNLVGPILGLVYVLLAALMFFPGLMTLRLAKAAKAFKKDGAATDLELVAANSKNLAVFNGVLLIVILGIYVLAIVGVILFSALRLAGVGN